MTVALYPGSFDPVTKGHVDIAVRAAALFDKLIIGIFDAPPKNLLFNTEERVAMMKETLAHVPNIMVTSYSNLTVNFVKELGAQVIVRGLRMGSDFEHEFDMALMNQRQAPEIDTVCLMAHAEYQFISSSLLKEVARFGGRVEVFVPENVAAKLKNKFPEKFKK